jgi:hypothetical protein
MKTSNHHHMNQEIIKIEIDAVNDIVYYQVNINDIRPTMYGVIDGIVEPDFSGGYTGLISNDPIVKEKEFKTKIEAQQWTEQQMQREINYYKNFQTK